MATRLNPYLSFGSDTRAAMEFYRSIFGGELSMSTFAEFDMGTDPADADKVMHAQLVGRDGIEFMAADTPTGQQRDSGSSVTMSLFGEDADALTGYFTKLAEGGTTTMPLAPVPWGATFGMCIDRFGIAWMVNINQA